METIYVGERFPSEITKTLFLAGPSPRDPSHHNWREAALKLLHDVGYDGHVFVPMPREVGFRLEYDAQADWEQVAMARSDVVLFWVPRTLVELPGFTTNVEFGQHCRDRNVVLGYPVDAPKCAFLRYLADKNFVSCAHTLEETLKLALEKVGKGATRTGGECEVPLYLWNTPHFQSWLIAQKNAGNRLDGCRVELTFGVGPKKGFLLYWAAHVNVFVAAEQRNKANEIVIGRPDIKHTIGFAPHPSTDLMDTRIVLVREFRSTAVTADGFIREVPGGSGFKPENPEVAAAKEFAEETGITISPERLQPLPTRQVAGTITVHRAHVFVVQLTEKELAEAMSKQAEGNSFGVTTETEQTYVEVYSIRQLLTDALTDWANLGMIFAALMEGKQHINARIHCDVDVKADDRPSMTFPTFNIIDQACWDKYVVNNQSHKGLAILHFAASWAKYMDWLISCGMTLENEAENARREVDEGNIDSHMYCIAICVLADTWQHGEQLRRWHNLKYQKQNEGEVANQEPRKVLFTDVIG